jgi:dephospho-CoA kinase
MNFIEEVTNYLESGRQALAINTPEEKRCLKDLEEVAKNLKVKLITWNMADGFNNQFKDPFEALSMSVSESLLPDDAIVVYLDFHPVFNSDVSTCRLFRNLATNNAFNNDKLRRPVIFLSNDAKYPNNIKNELTFVDYALPDEEYLGAVFDYVKSCLPKQKPISEEDKDAIVRSCLGLNSSEAENTLALAVKINKGLNLNVIKTIKDEKAKIFKQGGILTYIPEELIVNTDEISGYDNLMDFMNKRKVAYSKKAKFAGLRPPKGIGLFGIAGTGKTTVAMMIAKILNLPLFLFDLSATFTSLVGESEARMREALAQASGYRGSVIVFDEGDKTIAGAQDAQGDNGVSKRNFSLLLDWLNRKDPRTFAVMTMNRLAGMPPELLRRGRLDQIFFVDTPNEETRQQIFKIHLNKRNISPTVFTNQQYAQLAVATDEFVGAEIEEVVNAATYLAYEKREIIVPTFDELVGICKSMIPLA